MNIKKVKPLFSSIIVTKDKYSIDDVPKGAFIDPKAAQGSLKEHQTVIAVGPMVRDIKVGDIVKLNPAQYARYAPYKTADGMREKINGEGRAFLGYEIPNIEIDGVSYLLIQDRDCEYIVEEYEEDKDSPLIIPDKSIIKA